MDVNKQVLRDIHEEAQSEIYGGHADFGRIRAMDFVTWYRETVGRTPGPGEIDIHDVDLVSAMRVFEAWLKAPYA